MLRSLQAAVDGAPDDVPLRLLFAEMLAEAGQHEEAVRHAATILQREPSNSAALSVIAGGRAPAPAPPPPPADVAPPSADLEALEAELADVIPPRFVGGDDGQGGERVDSFEVERADLRLEDVAGMEEVKARIEAAFLTPLRNPELSRLYAKSLRGGLLMYGPPGCGKTFIARALAGEIGARFLAVSLADILDMWTGQSERNTRELFELARRSAPCVIFLDEVDAIGQKRTQLRNSAARGTVNQLLSEMDGIATANDGVYVVGATNHPWDVDVALRRPGRFDRMLLVLPPDEPARAAVLEYHLRERPIESVDVRKLARRTDGYSGADLAHVCESAAERALLDSARSGNARMITMADLEHALSEVRPSIGAWLQTASNVAKFANDDGTYDDLLAYLRSRRIT
ncbi:MAG: AAA family ATPase [Solirubrobacteraceae bacterium]